MIKVSTRLAGTCLLMVLTAAALYTVEPAPFILMPAAHHEGSVVLQPGDTVASFPVKRQQAARLRDPIDVTVAGKHYTLQKGYEVRPYYVIMSGASKEVPHNTLVYCTPMEKVSKAERGGLIGVGSRYATYIQLCLAGDAPGKFNLAFLAGSKSAIDRVPIILDNPAPFDLVPDQESPTRMRFVYNNLKDPEIRLVLDDPDDQSLPEQDRRGYQSYFVVRPKGSPNGWTSFGGHVLVYDGIVRLKKNGEPPYLVKVLDGTLSIDGYDPQSHALRTHLVSVPTPGPFRVGLVSTEPIVIYH